jgi:hypothetical protein
VNNTPDRKASCNMVERQVGQDDYAYADAPDTISTMGLGPCIGAAVLNHSQAVAWLAHGSGWSVNEREFGEMVKDATAIRQVGDDITVWMGGGCRDPEAWGDEDGASEQVTADRAHVADRLRGLFPGAEVVEEFCDDPDVFAIAVTFAFDEGRWARTVETV